MAWLARSGRPRLRSRDLAGVVERAFDVVAILVVLKVDRWGSATGARRGTGGGQPAAVWPTAVLGCCTQDLVGLATSRHRIGPV